MSGNRETPELLKLAGRAMANDPEGPSGELVRAWKALLAENQRLREALEEIQAITATDTASPVQRIAREALASDAE